MDSDIRPPRRPVKSLQASLDERAQVTETKNPEKFRTPEEVAADQTASLPADEAVDQEQAPPRGGWRQKLAAQWPPSRRALIISGVVLIGLIGVIGTLMHRPKSPVASIRPAKAIVKLPPKPTTVPSTLTGLSVDPSVNQRPVTGVMIENSLQARPQSGLGQAGVVFEAIAEGGITRFLALYQDSAPDNVGPIRSARPYYAQWALGFDASLAHVGGSPEALADIKAWGVKDLDQFHNSGSYHRIASRAAPHNVYTSIAALNQLEAAKGYGASQYTGFAHKTEAPLKVPTAKTIDLTLSGAYYNVHYDYDAKANSYQRSEAGAAHLDANTNTVIAPKVVVALVMPYSLEADGYHSDYGTIGNGPLYVFQDGGITTGQWSKASNNAQFNFTDAAGQSLKLNPGQTWVTAVSAANKVVYKP